MLICFDAGLKGSHHHRNVMISDDGTPILMDFGSTVKARIPIENRSQALMQQASLQVIVFYILCIEVCSINRTSQQSKVQWPIVHPNSST
jgi:hypothetical protein